jgi:hypothetical protein
MVAHSETEERLLADGSASRQGEELFLEGPRGMAFTAMPFGLCNARATFERLMETILRSPTYESCLMYPGDVIVPRAPVQPTESVPAVPGSLPKAQSGAIQLSEGITLPPAYLRHLKG